MDTSTSRSEVVSLGVERIVRRGVNAQGVRTSIQLALIRVEDELKALGDLVFTEPHQREDWENRMTERLATLRGVTEKLLAVTAENLDG